MTIRRKPLRAHVCNNIDVLKFLEEIQKKYLIPGRKCLHYIILISIFETGSLIVSGKPFVKESHQKLAQGE